MKNCLAPVLWMAVGAATLMPVAASAQVPFSSTQSPGLSPFNRSASLPPPAQPRPSSSQYPQASTNGNMPGNYPAASSVGPIDPDHRLGPRDVVSYSVAEDRDNEAYQLVVTDSGEVQLKLGSLRVKAAGKTPQQLAADIKSALEREYYRPGHATVSVGLIQVAPGASKGRVFITGEVAGKGAVDLPVDGQLTVVQAILQLGGFTLDSDLKGVYVYRKGAPAKGIRINAKAVLNGDADKDVVLQPGDTVKVEEKCWASSSDHLRASRLPILTFL